MYLGQVIFYSLDRLFLQYGHAVSNACIVIMPASSIVDSEVRRSAPAVHRACCHFAFCSQLPSLECPTFPLAFAPGLCAPGLSLFSTAQHKLRFSAV